MVTVVKTLGRLRNANILADQESLNEGDEFRQFNLVYGLNGSGKSTLSRLFSTLQKEQLDASLPEDCVFEFILDDESKVGHPANLSGTQNRVLVFNNDYIDANLHWSTGHANPVFYIGEDQADAAKELQKVSQKLKDLSDKTEANVARRQKAEKDLSSYKREQAKAIAGRLHLESRRYEAPALTKDMEKWGTADIDQLSDVELKKAELVTGLSTPPAKLSAVNFHMERLGNAYDFVSEACRKTLSQVALSEADDFPEMLIWLKEGHDFHRSNGREICLYCGNRISDERWKNLEAALDTSIDDYLAKLRTASERLDALSSDLSGLAQSIPNGSELQPDLKDEYLEAQKSVTEAIQPLIGNLNKAKSAIDEKQKGPGTTIDFSRLVPSSDFKEQTEAFSAAMQLLSTLIDTHNAVVTDFQKHQTEAEKAIRMHFVVEYRDEFARHEQEVKSAEEEGKTLKEETAKQDARKVELLDKIRKHGPAADVINGLISAYLGHNELTVSPLDEGYSLNRFGAPIDSAPSEGEKTAISIAYFLSSVEAEGRKLKDLIVVVDDAVSSLDTTALNYACSLLRGRLSKAAQLFIFTHNLQCLNEFRKFWKNKARPPEGKKPTASMWFLDVQMAPNQLRRSSRLVPLPKLLREYDSEYHYLSSLVFRFEQEPENEFEYAYLMPHVMRRVLETFLSFKLPGNAGLVGKLEQLCGKYDESDKDRISSLERLSQVESHSDNVDDLLSFSSMTLEESRNAVSTLVYIMEHVDPQHVQGLRKICGTPKQAA